MFVLILCWPLNTREIIMTDDRKERKGVVLPETSAATGRVNDNLMKKIKDVSSKQQCDGRLAYF